MKDEHIKEAQQKAWKAIEKMLPDITESDKNYYNPVTYNPWKDDARRALEAVIIDVYKSAYNQGTLDGM